MIIILSLKALYSDMNNSISVINTWNRDCIKILYLGFGVNYSFKNKLQMILTLNWKRQIRLPYHKCSLK